MCTDIYGRHKAVLEQQGHDRGGDVLIEKGCTWLLTARDAPVCRSLGTASRDLGCKDDHWESVG
jgi:hypothetical protein